MTAIVRNTTLAVLYALAIVDVLNWVSSFATDLGPKPLPEIVRAIYVLIFVTSIGLAAMIALVGRGKPE